MRSNGIHRARFAADGTLTECELDPKYMAPEAPAAPMTPMDQAVARDEAAKYAARQKIADDQLLFMASEGLPDNWESTQ